MLLAQRLGYLPVKLGTLFSIKACRASCASCELERISEALEVNTIVVSSELSSAARMIRLLVHCTSGGIANIASERFH